MVPSPVSFLLAIALPEIVMVTSFLVSSSTATCPCTSDYIYTPTLHIAYTLRKGIKRRNDVVRGQATRLQSILHHPDRRTARGARLRCLLRLLPRSRSPSSPSRWSALLSCLRRCRCRLAAFAVALAKAKARKHVPSRSRGLARRQRRVRSALEHAAAAERRGG